MGKGVKLAGPGRLGSEKAVKQSLKGGGSGNPNVRNIPQEKDGALTVRFLEEPEDFFGYYEHWENNVPFACTEDCEYCESDDPEVRKRQFRYLANAYVVDDNKVKVMKLPKSVFEFLYNYFKKYGTLLDRDYDLSRSGSGKEGTKYMAAPDSKQKMDLSRFRKKMFDLDEIAQSLTGGVEEDDDDDEDDDEPVSRKKKGKKRDPWEDLDDDDEDDDEDEDDEDDEDDEPVRRVKKKSKSKRTVSRKPVSKKKPIKKKSRK